MQPSENFQFIFSSGQGILETGREQVSVAPRTPLRGLPEHSGMDKLRLCLPEEPEGSAILSGTRVGRGAEQCEGQGGRERHPSLSLQPSA